MEIATIAGALAPLAGLACVLALPVGMGVMVWMTARGGKTTREHPPSTGYRSRSTSPEGLRNEHRRLSAAIEELERGSKTVALERER